MRKVGKLLVPSIADRTVHIAKMRLIWSRQHPPGERGRGRDHSIVACDVELLDKEGARKEQMPVIFLDERQSVRNGRVKRDAVKILLFHIGRQKIE